MKFIASTALFAACVQAEWPLDMAPTGLPSGQCLVYPAKKEHCASQWNVYDSYCSEFWDDDCQRVLDAWDDNLFK